MVLGSCTPHYVVLFRSKGLGAGEGHIPGRGLGAHNASWDGKDQVGELPTWPREGSTKEFLLRLCGSSRLTHT